MSDSQENVDTNQIDETTPNVVCKKCGMDHNSDAFRAANEPGSIIIKLLKMIKESNESDPDKNLLITLGKLFIDNLESGNFSGNTPIITQLTPFAARIDEWITDVLINLHTKTNEAARKTEHAEMKNSLFTIANTLQGHILTIINARATAANAEETNE